MLDVGKSKMYLVYVYMPLSYWHKRFKISNYVFSHISSNAIICSFCTSYNAKLKFYQNSMLQSFASILNILKIFHHCIHLKVYV